MRRPESLTKRMPLSGGSSPTGPDSTPPTADRSRCRQPRSAMRWTSPPETLARVLDGQPDWHAQEGNRLPCLQLFPVEANADCAAATGARQRRATRQDPRQPDDDLRRRSPLSPRRARRPSRRTARALRHCLRRLHRRTQRMDRKRAPGRSDRQASGLSTTSADAIVVLKAVASAPVPGRQDRAHPPA